MPGSSDSSKRIGDHFFRTKLSCFGRYAMDLPEQAQLDWGGTWFPSRIEVYQAVPGVLQRQIEKDIASLQKAENTFEIIKNEKAQMKNGWELRYYRNKHAKARGFFVSNMYVELGGALYLLRAAPESGEAEAIFDRRTIDRIAGLRVRSEHAVPSDPGFCVEGAFMVSASYGEQEMINAGIHIPAFPDVTFSVSSNKDAYSDYSPAEFNGRLRKELSLLTRIKDAQLQQGVRYPKRTVLREGKRTVQHWHGEESLIRRADGTHDFEWAFVGTPGDVANPSEFNVQMYTKVAHNTVGAADKASLTDDEAIALWDKLLAGLKFRVKVPGAPEGSYYFLPGAATGSGAKP